MFIFKHSTMKTYAITLFALLAFSVNAMAQAASSSNEPPKETIVFDTTVFEFGEIEFGGDGNCTFTFTNNGDEPIMLSAVRASCGCTSPNWTKDPVKPGEKGEIKVKYNTRIPGAFSKSISVYSNATPSPIVLRIKGQVIKNEQQKAIR